MRCLWNYLLLKFKNYYGNEQIFILAWRCYLMTGLRKSRRKMGENICMYAVEWLPKIHRLM